MQLRDSHLSSLSTEYWSWHKSGNTACKLILQATAGMEWFVECFPQILACEEKVVMIIILWPIVCLFCRCYWVWCGMETNWVWPTMIWTVPRYASCQTDQNRVTLSSCSRVRVYSACMMSVSCGACMMPAFSHLETSFVLEKYRQFYTFLGNNIVWRATMNPFL